MNHNINGAWKILAGAYGLFSGLSRDRLADKIADQVEKNKLWANIGRLRAF